MDINTLTDLNNFCLLLQQKLILIFTTFIKEDKSALNESTTKDIIIQKIQEHPWSKDELNNEELQKLLSFCNNCSSISTVIPSAISTRQTQVTSLPLPPPTDTAPPTATAPPTDTDPFEKYSKMRKMLPEGAVRQKMSNDGIPSEEIDAFFITDGRKKLTSKKSKEHKKNNVISKRITKKSPRKQKNRT